MIKALKEGLKEISENVQYGVCKKGDTWDCLLIRKNRKSKSGKSNTDDSFYVTVSIIREDEIPDGMEEQVEAKMKDLRYRRTSADAIYDYVTDQNDIVVEICVMEFVKPSKGK